MRLLRQQELGQMIVCYVSIHQQNDSVRAVKNMRHIAQARAGHKGGWLSTVRESQTLTLLTLLVNYHMANVSGVTYFNMSSLYNLSLVDTEISTTLMFSMF